MKIGLLVTNEPYSKQVCGVSSYVRNLLPYLAPLGIEPVLFWIEGEGAKYRRRIRGFGEYRSIHVPNPALTRALAAWIASERPDLLHGHWTFAESMALLRDLPPTAPPTIITFHTFEAVCPLKTHTTVQGDLCSELPGAVCMRTGCRSARKWLMHDVPMRLLARNTRSRARAYLAHNQELRELALASGFRPVHCFPLGVNPATEGPPRRGRRLLYAGRLRPEKGVATLAEAIPRIFARVPDAEIRIAGEGPMESLFRDFHGVRLLGVLGDAALREEYANARALVFPSLWKENFGLSGPEAMASGTPVLAPATGGIREWLRDGENGLAFPRGDAKALADAAVAILTDDALSAKLGEGALRTSRELSMRIHAERLVAVYRETAGAA